MLNNFEKELNFQNSVFETKNTILDITELANFRQVSVALDSRAHLLNFLNHWQFGLQVKVEVEC